METRQGRRTARLVGRLLKNETALVIVLVLGLNLCLEVMTNRVEGLLLAAGAREHGIELLIALVVTPVVLFLGELVPKELARRRPHGFLGVVSPVVLVSRVLFWPVERIMYAVTALTSRALKLEPRLFSSGQGREAVLDFLREGRRSGAIPTDAEAMARNVLKLRTISVERCMVAWKDTTRLDARDPNQDLYEAVLRSPHTRLIVVGAGGDIEGYVHQLDVLGEGPDEPVLSHLRDIHFLEPGLAVDKALARLRATGQRLAVVGGATRPLGILTLKDLLEEISGDLAGW
jgi:putative hemolysin